MVTAKDERERFPHIRFREVNGRNEAYLVDSGLAIWEIAWLAPGYGGDAQAIADNHTVVSADLIEEGLRYAAAHAEETEAEIKDHTAGSLEELQEKLPGVPIKVFYFDASEDPRQSS